MESEQKARQYILYCSDSPERRFVFSKDADDSATKKANYLTPAQKFKANALGNFGTISDAYILYMIALMEFSTEETITKLLQAYARDNKALEIISDRQGIGYRIHKLCGEFAMCFMRQYSIPSDRIKDTITLWGCDTSTISFINRRMSKTVAGRDGTIYDNTNSMISKASASFVAATVAMDSGCRFKGLLETGMRTAELGNRLLPPILFLEGAREVDYEVMFYPAYLNMVTGFQTKADYKNMLKRKCDEIKNFLYTMSRNPRKEGYVVVVCESREDIESFARLCEQLHYCIDCGNIERIYLTSEGAVRVISNLENVFLKMEKNQEGAVTLIQETPPFIQKR